MEAVKTAYKSGKQRLLLLDYDGVLVDLAPTPAQAWPSSQVLTVLRGLTADPCNTVVIISGRPPETLGDWLGGTGVDMSAEHGHFIKKAGHDWERVQAEDLGWKQTVRQRMAAAVHEVPASHIEEKHTSLVWHYRQSPLHQAELGAHKLYSSLRSLNDIHVSRGAKIIEARLPGADKGQAASRWLNSAHDFILAAGDDTTDEDLFNAVPANAFTVKIGAGPTAARHRLKAPAEFIFLLKSLVL